MPYALRRRKHHRELVARCFSEGGDRQRTDEKLRETSEISLKKENLRNVDRCAAAPATLEMPSLLCVRDAGTIMKSEESLGEKNMSAN